LDDAIWDVVVTWNHGLRERIVDLTFPSRNGAERWIARASSTWLELEGLHLKVAVLRNNSRKAQPIKARRSSRSRIASSKRRLTRQIAEGEPRAPNVSSGPL
jgi:hypothetical protein